MNISETEGLLCIALAWRQRAEQVEEDHAVPVPGIEYSFEESLQLWRRVRQIHANSDANSPTATTIKCARRAAFILIEVSLTATALWYIESHLNSDLGLDAVAEVVGVSRFHLSRAFAASAGISFAGYVRARRLSLAARSLAGGAPDILAVALDAGYDSHEAFTRAFRQHFGVTPEQLRGHASTDTLTLQEPIRMNKATTTALSTPLGWPRKTRC